MTPKHLDDNVTASGLTEGALVQVVDDCPAGAWRRGRTNGRRTVALA